MVKEDGANTTLIHAGHVYVFSEGVMQSAHSGVEDIQTGMTASEVILLAGIPAGGSTAAAIDGGADMTLNYEGRSYVFSKGVLQVMR